MMFGMLKKLGSTVLREQARSDRRRKAQSLFLQQDLVDHMALERRRGSLKQKGARPVAVAV